jgi:hypothetical protein
MARKFRRHYTLAEARSLLPQVRLWFTEIDRWRHVFEEADAKLSKKLSAHHDLGGEVVNRWVKALAGIGAIIREFEKREIQLKDIERGLIDFPALREGREVFLCWEKDEDDIEFWHDIESGFAGRERL